jgi:hypothetical protein
LATPDHKKKQAGNKRESRAGTLVALELSNMERNYDPRDALRQRIRELQHSRRTRTLQREMGELRGVAAEMEACDLNQVIPVRSDIAGSTDTQRIKQFVGQAFEENGIRLENVEIARSIVVMLHGPLVVDMWKLMHPALPNDEEATMCWHLEDDLGEQGFWTYLKGVAQRPVPPDVLIYHNFQHLMNRLTEEKLARMSFVKEQGEGWREGHVTNG